MPRQSHVGDLPIHPVNPDSPVPLYHQVENDLETLIKSGVIGTDDLLPPEVELSKVYGVGRQTIRMALSRLVANRLIERRAGRGTVILPEPERKSFYLDRSFTRQMAEMGMTTYSRVLLAAPGEVAANAPKSLRDQIGARCFYLTRLRYGNDRPIGLQYTTIMTA
ncbi:MAG: GntR family transcriptional regulator, partial [Anaerolineae bacterium]|nr:GntR family transcriptional regulator [Anaerolineae bacterium]